MPDILLRQLWLAAIIIRGLSFLIGIWKCAPVWWLTWVAVSELFAFGAHRIDAARNGPLYLEWWIAEQWACIAVMGVYVWRDIQPLFALSILATCIVGIVGVQAGMTDHWADFYLEPTMYWVGLQASHRFAGLVPLVSGGQEAEPAT